MARRACESLRVEYRNDFTYYVEVFKKLLESRPGFKELLDIVSESYIVPPVVVVRQDLGFLEKLVESTIAYYEALHSSMSFEDARYLLPRAVKTRVIVSMNARELVEIFLPLRVCTRAGWEMRHIAWSPWRQLMEKHPAIFKYTGPRCVLMENHIRRNPVH